MSLDRRALAERLKAMKFDEDLSEHYAPLDPAERDLLLRLLGEEAEPRGWQPIETAPKDGTCVVMLTRGGSVVRASFGNLGDDAWTWIATNDDEHPKCWTDGACWESNEDDEPSDQPVYWMPLPPSPPPDTESAKEQA